MQIRWANATVCSETEGGIVAEIQAKAGRLVSRFGLCASATDYMLEECPWDICLFMDMLEFHSQ